MESEFTVEHQPGWDKLRSDIYLRDRGICWVCNGFVQLDEYDLGHLIDKCRNGQPDYDNLAVMHERCNSSKPRHDTLEQAMKWRLTCRFMPDDKPNAIVSKEALVVVSQTQQLPQSNEVALNYAPYPDQPILPRPIFKTSHHKNPPKDEQEIMRQLVVEHFTTHPELTDINHKNQRAKTLKEFSETFNCSIQYVRKWITDANMIPSKQEVRYDSSRYTYILEHLQELLDKYHSLTCKETAKPKMMGMTRYTLDIVLYLGGVRHHINAKDLDSIQQTVAKLRIPMIASTSDNVRPDTPS